MVFKIVFSSLAILFVFRKLSLSEFLISFKSVPWFYILLAIVSFNLSKLVAAFRLWVFYKQSGTLLNHLYNIKLYYIGMFYNLFLPGSVGGDAYKVVQLKQDNDNSKSKDLIAATFLDRLSGVVLLGVIAIALIMGSTLNSHIPYSMYLVGMGILGSLIVYYFLTWFFFKKYVSVFHTTSLLSFIVQVGQVFCAIALLRGFGVRGVEMYDYLFLFMFSSVAAILPISIGGMGVRESIYILGYQYLPINKELAVAFSLLFFTVLAITGLGGLIVIVYDFVKVKGVRKQVINA